MTDKTLRERKTYEGNNPDWAYIWGRDHDILKNGGYRYNPDIHFDGVYEWVDQKPRSKPRVKKNGYGEELVEPEPTISNFALTGSIIRSFVRMGWTFDGAVRALDDPSNLGGTYHRWANATDPGWWTTLKYLWHSREITRSSGVYQIIPSEDHITPLEGNAGYHPHPSIQAMNVDTGECVSLLSLEQMLYGYSTESTHTTSTPYIWFPEKVEESLNVFLRMPGLGRRDAATALTEARIHRYDSTSQKYIKHMLLEGLIDSTKVPGANGGRVSITISDKGRQWLNERNAAALAQFAPVEDEIELPPLSEADRELIQTVLNQFKVDTTV